MRLIFGCLSIVGIICLAAGGALLFMARGPQSSADLAVGGTQISQAQVAQEAFGATYSQENPPDLPVVVDGVETSTNSVGAEPQLGDQALSDVSTTTSEEPPAEVAANAAAPAPVIDAETVIQTVPLQVSAVTVDTSGAGGASRVGRVEQRQITLEFPKSFRVGGSGNVRLTITALASGEIRAVPEIENNALIATPLLITDNHDTHIATFSARLIAPEAQVESLTSAAQSIGRGQEATWRWTVQAPKTSGTFVMTFVLDLSWQPRGAGQPIPQQTIWSQAVQGQAEYVFGSITVPQASLLGGVLGTAGFVAQLPITGTLVAYYMGSRRRNRTPGRSSSSRTRRRY